MKFQDLEQHAKDYALQRHAENLDYDWWDCTYADFVEICKRVGFDVTTTLGRKGINDYEIRFSGFWSQGDGASFGATFSLLKGLDAPKEIREYCNDDALFSIADKVHEACISAMGVSHMLSFNGTLQLGIKLGNAHYSHSNTMQLSSESAEFLDMPDDIENEAEVIGICSEFDAAILDAARKLADWLYEQLRAEYEYLTSEDSLIEAAEANDWEFDEAGTIVLDNDKQMAA